MPWRRRSPIAAQTRSGLWSDAEAGVVLGHTRLSIVDLSPAGAQPMVSSCGACVVTYNGEIYNAGELRPELEARGRRFKGHSDTEVLVEAIAAWGVERHGRAPHRHVRLRALGSRKTRTLSLVRDRLGIKPLYWGRQNGRLVFASELKAFAALPAWQPGARPRRARRLSAARLCARAAFDLSRHPQARSPGMSPPSMRDGQVETRRVLESRGGGRAGQGKPASSSATRKRCDALEFVLGDAVRTAARRRRAAGRVSVGRHRLLG